MVQSCGFVSLSFMGPRETTLGWRIATEAVNQFLRGSIEEGISEGANLCTLRRACRFETQRYCAAGLSE
ncbi:hypothetical protein H6F86_26750 [Phormidium sp. FACHB-592]|uniref:Uncharacterized protein n=1 Tax=Stenomitos frigidus AS-A4 TaxID=2933935 RepID=A0ABV0KU73_9CYAN|nr:hypothetical protein [Phormidium sp. FACHB-592]MBD2077417.1 hypothetical protein [Phormidium sp. FACHB-592]